MSTRIRSSVVFTRALSDQGTTMRVVLTWNHIVADSYSSRVSRLKLGKYYEKFRKK